MYSVLFSVAVAVTWVGRDFGSSTVDSLSNFDACKQQEDEQLSKFCQGKETVLRFTFATFMFFAAQGLLVFVVSLFRQSEATKYAHTGLLPLRAVVWAGLVVLCFLTMPSSVFAGFFQFARIAAAVFLVFQIVVLVDFVYWVNQEMLSWERGAAAVVASTVVLFALGMAGIVAAYCTFAPNAGCRLNIFYITMTLVLGLAVSALSVSPLRPQSVGLLTAMLMFAYCTFVLTSALYSQPRDLPCSPTPAYTTVNWNLVLGFVISVVSLIVGVVRMGGDTAPFFYQESIQQKEADAPYSAVLFHTIFACATCYVAMLLTNWSIAGVPNHFQLDVGAVSAWMKIVTQWICYFVFAWTLAAPAMFPDRDFGH